MFRAIFVFTCASCNKSYPTDTRIPDVEDIPVFPVYVDFKTGMIQFTCPECQYLNRISLPNDEDIKKRNRLPGIRVM